MVKKPSQQANNKPTGATAEQAEALADKLADKPYGDPLSVAPPAPETLSRTTLSLPTSLVRKLEDMALQNKREGKELRSMSAIVREALQKYLA